MQCVHCTVWNREWPGPARGWSVAAAPSGSSSGSPLSLCTTSCTLDTGQWTRYSSVSCNAVPGCQVLPWIKPIFHCTANTINIVHPCCYTGFHLTENKMVSDGHWDTSIVLVQPHTSYCWTASSVAQMMVLPTLKKKLFPLILQFNLSIQPIHVLSCFSHDMKKIYEW